MEIFTGLLLKLIPLYLVIFLGFVAGRKYGVARESIAPLLLYIVTPIVTFKGIFESELSLKTFSYPLYFLTINIIIAISFLAIAKTLFKDKEKASLVSLCAGLANVGYFGLPVALMIFGEEVLGIVVLIILGFAIHESSFAFFIAASGKYDLKEALFKTLRLPAIYTSIAAVLANYLYNNFYLQATETTQAVLGPYINAVLKTCDMALGSYALLGMMLVGLGLSKIKKIKFDWAFISLAFTAKFLVYPLITLAFVYLNQHYWHFYDDMVLKIMLLMSVVPMAANTITIATELKMNTDTISVTTFLSTIFALFYIPLIVLTVL